MSVQVVINKWLESNDHGEVLIFRSVELPIPPFVGMGIYFDDMTMFEVDSRDTLKTGTKQMKVWAFPLSRFPFQGQEAIKKEVQKRAKAEKDKVVLYPEPPPEKVAAEKPPARPPVNKRPKRTPKKA